MNLFLGLIILCLSVYIGTTFSKKYKDKVIFYSNFSYFNQNLKNEISFTQKTINCLLEKEKNNKNYFYNNLNAFFLKKEIDNNAINCNFLDDKEKAYFISYITTIGKGDKNSQLSYLNNVSAYLEERYKSAILDEKKYKTLNIKLGFLIGLTFLIILL